MAGEDGVLLATCSKESRLNEKMTHLKGNKANTLISEFCQCVKGTCRCMYNKFLYVKMIYLKSNELNTLILGFGQIAKGTSRCICIKYFM